MKKHPFLFTVVLLAVLTALIAAIAPSLLSSEKARTLIVDKVNAVVPGELAIDAWHFSWAKGVTIEGFSFEQDEPEVVARVERIRLNKGLLGLLLDRKDLGRIEIHKPHVTASIPEPLPDVEATPTSDKPTVKGPRSKTSKSEPKRVVSVNEISIPDVQFELVVMEGSVDVVPLGRSATPLVRDVHVEVNMTGAVAPVTYDVTARTGEGGNALELSGETTLSKDGVLRIGDIESQTVIVVDQWNVEELLSLLSTFSDVPRGRGLLDVRLDLRGSMEEGMRAQGMLSLKDLAVEALGKEDTLKHIDDIRIDMDGILKDASVKLDKLSLKSPFLNVDATGQYGGYEEGSFHADVSSDIAQLAAMLIRVGVMPDDVMLSGTCKGVIDGQTRGGAMVLDDALITLTDLSIEKDGKTFREDELTIRKRGSANLSEHTAVLSLMEVQASFGKLVAEHFEIKDLTKVPATISLTGRLNIDLAKALASGADFITLESGAAVRGFVSSSITIDVIDANRQRIEVAGLVSELAVSSSNGPPMNEDEMGLKLKSVITIDPLNISVEELALRSSLAHLELQGAYDVLNEQHGLRIDGTTAFDLTRAAGYLRAFTGLDVTMHGKGSKPFHIASSWSATEANGLWRHADMRAGFAADHIRYLGVEINQLDVPLVCTDGRAEVAIEAEVNEGQLTVQPVVDFRTDVPVLSFADESTIMSGVKLTGEMADEMLAKIHPLFKGASVVGGELELHMKHFNLPLTERASEQAAFEGAMHFKNLELGSSGMLNDVLDTLKIRERSIDVGDRDIEFECVQGRVTCSPMKLKVDDYRIVISGSMGLDQTLDYIAEVPLTKELVGEEYYPYAEGLTFRVPIRGTAEDPEVNMNALNEAIADLGRQAARKLIEEKAGDLIKDIFK